MRDPSANVFRHRATSLPATKKMDSSQSQPSESYQTPLFYMAETGIKEEEEEEKLGGLSSQQT
jgi:hypothetical protein